MNVIMPQLGETVAEGKIAKWFKSAGEKVQAGENLFEIETDKVTMEVQATESGVLSEIRVAEGETVPVGTIVAVLGGSGDPVKAVPAAAPAAKRPATPATPASNSAAPATPMAVPARQYQPFVLQPFEEVRTPMGNYGSATLDGLKITPLARRLSKESGVALSVVANAVRARGGWRIAAADIKAAPTPRAEAASRRAPIVLRDGDAIEKLSRIRAQTAAHLAEAWRTIPHAFQAVEVDFSAIAKVRDAAKKGFAERNGFALTYLPFVARAVCLALADFPRVNASFDHDQLILHKGVGLGIAADLDHEGLVVPVVHHADEMSAAGLAKAIARQIEKTRDNKLTPDDLAGGTYSITNNGSFGTFFTAPIINAPQVAILSFDAVRRKPVAIDGKEGESVAVRPVAMLGQSFDHRAFDGGYAASFLARVKEIAETQDWTAELG